MTTNTDTAPIICRSLRQLDALVAERLFGWVWWRLLPCGFRSVNAGQYRVIMDLPHEKAPHKDTYPFIEPATGDEVLHPDWDRDLPHYTTWAMMPEIVAKVEAADDNGARWKWNIDSMPESGGYWATLQSLSPTDSKNHSGIHELAPVALCLAALAAFGCSVRLELGGEL